MKPLMEFELQRRAPNGIFGFFTCKSRSKGTFNHSALSIKNIAGKCFGEAHVPVKRRCVMFAQCSYDPRVARANRGKKKIRWVERVVKQFTRAVKRFNRDSEGPNIGTEGSAIGHMVQTCSSACQKGQTTVHRVQTASKRVNLGFLRVKRPFGEFF